jgi:hypothetical protein
MSKRTENLCTFIYKSTLNTVINYLQLVCALLGRLGPQTMMAVNLMQGLYNKQVKTFPLVRAD